MSRPAKFRCLFPRFEGYIVVSREPDCNSRNLPAIHVRLAVDMHIMPGWDSLADRSKSRPAEPAAIPGSAATLRYTGRRIPRPPYIYTQTRFDVRLQYTHDEQPQLARCRGSTVVNFKRLFILNASIACTADPSLLTRSDAPDTAFCLRTFAVA